MSYVVETDPLLIDFDLDTQYTSPVNPLAVDFGIGDVGLRSISRSLIGSPTINVESSATLQLSNINASNSLIKDAIVNFDLDTQYTSPVNPLAVDFGIGVIEGSINGSAVVRILPTTTMLYTNVGIARTIVGDSNFTVDASATTLYTRDSFVYSIDGESDITVSPNASFIFTRASVKNVTTDETRLVPATSQIKSGVDFSTTIGVETIKTGNITSVRAVLREDDNGKDINITNNNSSFTLSGSYLGAFRDVFTYTDAGETNKTQTPKTAIGLENLPPEQNLFEFKQDRRQSVDIRYDVTVTYTVTIQNTTIGGFGNSYTTYSGTEYLTFTHTVIQNLEAVRRVMQNYKYNGTGAIA